MSESENVLARWARRKSEARASGPVAAPISDGEILESDSEVVLPNSGAPPFDPESLPAIETIDAGTDMRAFVGKGVPADLTRAALRRAWSADPTIRDFIGLSENSWDFNDPTAMHGFGVLEPAEVQKVIAHMLKDAESTEGAIKTPADPVSSEVSSALLSNGATQDSATHPASLENAARQQVSSRTLASADDPDGTQVDDPYSPARGELLAQFATDNPEPPRRRHGGALPREAD